MIRKLKKFDWIYIAVGTAFVICGLFLPKSGRMALLDVAFDVMLVWGIVIYLLLKVRKADSSIRKKMYIYIICGFLGVFAIFHTTNIARDVVSGPHTISLGRVTVSQIQGIRGIAFLHYYLNGEDSAGNRYRIEISADEYKQLKTKNVAVVTYYEHTKRLYSLGTAK